MTTTSVPVKFTSQAPTTSTTTFTTTSTAASTITTIQVLTDSTTPSTTSTDAATTTEASTIIIETTTTADIPTTTEIKTTTEITTTAPTSSSSTITTEAVPVVTTVTPNGRRMDNLECGDHGRNSGNNCICFDGYRGVQCEIPPIDLVCDKDRILVTLSGDYAKDCFQIQ